MRSMGNWRKGLAVLLCAGLLLCAGCQEEEQSSQTAQDDVKVYALVTKSAGNPYNELMAEGFTAAIEEAGGNCIISEPEEGSVEAQVECIEDLISMGVDAIAVAANDEEALSDILQEAMEEGIYVSTVDSDVLSEDRQVFVNQVATDELAEVLVEAVYDITGGSGQWAILSASSQATNQNAWIRAMQKVLEDEKYKDLRLVDIVYGNDESELSAELTQQLLEEYPQLKVICAPTVVGILAVAQVLAEQEDTQVKVTGLGLPSEMAEYVTGKNAVCPYLFLWNPIELGQMSAYVSIALVEGSITGEEGEVFWAGDMGLFSIEITESGSTQVIAGEPIRFDEDTIDDWKDLF